MALKVLPQAFTDDPDRLARFERETKVLASLNHPNIGHIYGLEEAEGTKALVLELIEGPTLADRIAQGPIPVDEALPIAKQIAEALEAAHEQGVIHRDLKPANVKVRPDGMVKVLDFGLAKAFEPEAGSVSASMSPTISLTAAATQLGMVIGTAAYMAPEQAKGLPVDKRADIWAYGAVIFEMLTGKKLFEAGDVSEMLASVLVKDPDISSIGTHVPDHVRSVVRRCLVKNPKERLRDIGDVRLAMRAEVETAVSRSVNTSRGSSPGWSRSMPLAAAALFVGVVVGVAGWNLITGGARDTTRVTRFRLTLPDTDIMTATSGLALSQSGDRIVYSARRDGVRQLFVRALDQLEAQVIPGSEGARFPFFSPDGEWVGYFAPSALMKVSLSGEVPVTLAERVGVNNGATWGPDDTIVYSYSGVGLLEISAQGGEPRVLTTPEATEGHRWPAFAPDGTHVFFAIGTGPTIGGDKQVAVLSMTTGEHKLIVEGTGPRMSPSGHLLFGRENSLWAAPFDLVDMALAGDPRPIVEGVQVNTPGGWAQYALADDGTLAYFNAGGSTGGDRSLVWVDRRGQEEPIVAPPAQYSSPRLSPDGGSIAVQVDDGSDTHVRVYDVQSGTSTRLTFGDSDDVYPIWTPDGEHVAFGSTSGVAPNLFWTLSDGVGQPELLAASENAQMPLSWSTEEDLVFFEMRGNGDVGMLSPSNPSQPEWLLTTEFRESHAEVSPDGRWLAYLSNESGADQVCVRPFPNVEDGRWLVWNGVAHPPKWGPDSRELFFRDRSTRGMVVVMTLPPETEPA